MAEGSAQSSSPDFAALFRQWLSGFGVLGQGAPWDSLRALGEALQGAARVSATDGAGAPVMADVLCGLLRDFRSRLDLLIDLPDPPSVMPPFSAFPMLGPAREWQLSLEHFWQCWAAERAAANALQRADWRVLSAGLATFESALASRGDLPDSLMELHARLVEHCEAAHQTALGQEAYVAAFGAHANAALALREAMAALAERGLPLLGIPRPSELQALEARLAALESKWSGAQSTAPKPTRRRAPSRSAKRAGPA